MLNTFLSYLNWGDLDYINIIFILMGGKWQDTLCINCTYRNEGGRALIIKTSIYVFKESKLCRKKLFQACIN